MSTRRPTAADLIGRIENASLELVEIERRHRFLAAFEKELLSATRGEAFTIMNELVWRVMLDARDLGIVRLWEWGSAATNAGQGGVLSAIHLVGGAAFYVREKRRRGDYPRREGHWSLQTDPGGGEIVDEALARREHAARLEVLERRFPGARKERRTPNSADFEALLNEWRTRFEPLEEPRHAIAHPPYGEKANHRAWTLRMAGIEEIIDYAKEVLGDLRLLLDRSQWSASHQFDAPEQTAKELVDMVLLGGLDQMSRLSGMTDALQAGGGRFPYQYRGPLYDALWRHRQCDSEPFNDPRQFLDAEVTEALTPFPELAPAGEDEAQ